MQVRNDRLRIKSHREFKSISGLLFINRTGKHELISSAQGQSVYIKNVCLSVQVDGWVDGWLAGLVIRRKKPFKNMKRIFLLKRPETETNDQKSRQSSKTIRRTKNDMLLNRKETKKWWNIVGRWSSDRNWKTNRKQSSILNGKRKKAKEKDKRKRKQSRKEKRLFNRVQQEKKSIDQITF